LTHSPTVTTTTTTRYNNNINRRQTSFKLLPACAIIEKKRVGICQKRKLTLNRRCDSRIPRSRISKHQNALHQEVIDFVLIQGLPRNESAKTACSH
jgi:hypothetical protein